MDCITKTMTDLNWEYRQMLAGNVDDRKSTSSGAFFLGKRLVSWTSEKKIHIWKSTIEAKYVVAAMNCKNVVWIKQLLKGIK